jgi:predicted outer membrane repeat protein
MKKIIVTIIVTLLIGSCSDSINDLFDELNGTVPICVDSTSTATAPDGRGWKNAYPSIDAALASPRALDGAEIWVKAGIYNVGTTTTINSTSPSVSIYGGFNGAEQTLSQRNIYANITTIQVTTYISAFSISGFEGNILIDGFTFNKSGTNGSGLSITNSSSVTVRNCIFNTLQTLGYGSAISIDSTTASTTNVFIANSEFINNKANFGGGAIYINQSIGTTNAYIKSSKFTSNSTTSGTEGDGGAIYCYRGKTTIDACNFNNNSVFVGKGGAIYTKNEATAILSIANSCFYDNQANTYEAGFPGPPPTYGTGGAIFIERAPSGQNHTFVNLTFFNNRAQSYGGGICYGTTGTQTIYNSVFYQNTSSDQNTQGSGNIHKFGSDALTLENCFLYAGFGGIVTVDSTCISNSNDSPFESIVESNSNFLYPASAIRDVGLNSAPNLPVIDLAGNPRVVGSAVDMGAYEAQ